MQSSRSFGARGDEFLLRLGRARPLVSFARHDLRRWLEQADLPAEVVQDLILACSEACANAVEHPEEASRQVVEIEGRRAEGHVEVRVRDYGRWRDNAPSDVHGRGLGIIRTLVEALDVEHHPEATEIVMRRSTQMRPRTS
jgi:anti-sigma regulatory factor (Ser/Thr protein kinase)